MPQLLCPWVCIPFKINAVLAVLELDAHLDECGLCVIFLDIKAIDLRIVAPIAFESVNQFLGDIIRVGSRRLGLSPFLFVLYVKVKDQRQGNRAIAWNLWAMLVYLLSEYLASLSHILLLVVNDIRAPAVADYSLAFLLRGSFGHSVG